MCKIILAALCVASTAAPLTAQAQTPDVVSSYDVPLASDPRSSCVFVQFESSSVGYAIPRNDPAFADAKQVLFASNLNGKKVNYIPAGNVQCGIYWFPGLQEVWTGTWH